MAIIMKQAVKRWATDLLEVWLSLKDKRLQWRMDRQASQLQMQNMRLLAENDLAGELKIRRAQLEHELGLLKTTHQSQLTMHKTKCQQNVDDYRQYLASLEQLKQSIQNSYADLPDVIAFTIHHHAKQLLNAMWEAQTVDETMRHELQLIRFMSTIQEDTHLHLKGGSSNALPEKTLHWLEHQTL